MSILVMEAPPTTSTQFGIERISEFEWDQSMGIALRKARNKQQISMRDLEKKIVSQTGVKFCHRYIGNLENGEVRGISREKLVAITKTLGITINDLFT